MSQTPLNALRAFEAVARHGSFRAASEALFVTQSAVSHQIRHLEEWFGVPLFDRSGGRPKLHPWGETLARELTLAFDDIETACRRTRRQARPDALVVAAIPSVAVCWLIPRLPRFHGLHPDVQLRVVYAHHGQQIDFNMVDLALVFSDVKPGGLGLRAGQFLSGTSFPVCSPAILKEPPASLSSEQFLEIGLLHDTDLSGWQLWFERAGLPLPERLAGPVFEDFNLLRAAALAGQGVALCPPAMIAPDLAEGRLVRLSDISVLENFDYYLIQSDRHPDREICAEARDVFVRWLDEERRAPAPVQR
ncbi:LysR family transcriptional regulator [Pontibaca methylaminivorans]|uniref:LysR family transcriptional regulator n=1 Tax=Pontibaca methylaminivorans TaxID=515897 RepID=UPI002FDB75F2